MLTGHFTNTTRIDFIGTSPSYTQTTGYRFTTSATEWFLRRVTSGTTSTIASGAVLQGHWYKLKITRGLNGAFKVYLDNLLVGVGTDNTHTTSELFGLTFHTNTRIRNFKHYVGTFDTPVAQIPLEVTAGRVNFSVSGSGLTDANVSWDYPDGTATNWDLNPDETLTAGGTVYLNFWKEPDWSTLKINDNLTGSGFVGDLSVFSRMRYALYMQSCGNITGDLSSVSNLEYQLDLQYCTSVTGDLSEVSQLTYWLHLENATAITGDLSSISNLTFYANLNRCSLVTGDLLDLSGVSSYVLLRDCNLVTGDLSSIGGLQKYLNIVGCTLIEGSLTPSTTLSSIYLSDCTGVDISQSLVNLEAVTTVGAGGVFQATHVNYPDLTSAGQVSATNLATAGWTITLGDGVVK